MGEGNLKQHPPTPTTCPFSLAGFLLSLCRSGQGGKKKTPHIAIILLRLGINDMHLRLGLNDVLLREEGEYDLMSS